jgi:putative tricarboxylic transport membrane protein
LAVGIFIIICAASDSGGMEIKMNQGEKSGIATVTIGVIYTILAYNMQRSTIGNPVEPMVFPLILGVTMTLSGIALFILSHLKKAPETVKKQGDQQGLAGNFKTKVITFICIVSVLYGMVFEKLGYIIATTLYLGALLLVFHNGKKKMINLLIAFGFSAAIYYCFSLALGIPLPKAPFLNI